MAKLLKLQICGIRSFGPYEDNVQQIKFSPLTLLLGQNGCGKTTIIEAIRYACTGDLPSNSSNGQGFVNDPKMSGKVITKGQIKLKIRAANGDEMTVCRIAEVTQKQTSQKFTSKPPTIRVVKPNGEEMSTSNRCVDVKNYCCQVLNVSPSVLSDVLLCHQENSCWPLDENKKVKERFDEIFDATKYNTYIEKLKLYTKEKEKQIKLLEEQFAFRRDKKEYVEKNKSRLEQKREKDESLQTNIATKQEELRPVESRIQEICDLENTLASLQRELATKEETKKGIIDQQNTIKSNESFEEFSGTDEELHDKVKSFEKAEQDIKTAITELEKRKLEVEKKSESINSAVLGMQKKMGTLKQEELHYQNKCSERVKLITKARELMDVTSYTQWDSSDGAKLAINELKEASENAQHVLLLLINDKESEEANLQKVIDEKRVRFTSTAQSINTKKNEIQHAERKIRDITEDLRLMDHNNDMLQDLTSKLEDLDRTLESLQVSFNEEEGKKSIEHCKRLIQSKEHIYEDLERDFKILQQNDVTESKIEAEKQSVIEKEHEVGRIKNKHSDNLKVLFGDEIPATCIKQAVLSIQNRSEDLVRNITDKINETQKEVTTLEAMKKNQQDKIKTSENELQGKRNKLIEVCNGESFSNVIEKVQNKREKLQTDRGQYNAASIIYKTFIEEFERDAPCCPVCQTDFRQKRDAVGTIIRNIRQKLQKFPNELADVEVKLRKEEETYDKLQQLQGENQDVALLTDVKLPSFKAELKKISTSLNSRMEELETLKIKLKMPQEKLSICRDIILDVCSLEQNQIDIDKSQKTISSLKEQVIRINSKKSKQEIEAEIDVLKADISNLRNQRETQLKNLTKHKDRQQKLLQERNATLSKQIILQDKVQGKPHLEKQKNELLEKNRTLKDDIARLECDLKIATDELQEAIENRQSNVKINKELVTVATNKVNLNKKLVDEIEKVQHEIDKYLQKDVETQLIKTETDLKDYKGKEDALRQANSKIIEAISSKRESLAKREMQFRILKDNLLLRSKKLLEEKLAIEVSALRQQIGGYNYRSVRDEKIRLVNQSEILRREINGIGGQKSELEVQIRELEEELSKPENKQAYKQYLSKYYEMYVTKNVVSDLGKYVIVLEKAVLEFHKLRMREINKTIREYWRDIYRGNDIDYIEIKTECSTGSMSKRSYNYKVVQVKKGIELDMRGRCSAGQKVLACLIIRMAIAETLSANCGILALDEPTTNLDRENIQSLSETLARIVDIRQCEKNFQLLIITHDEEFVRTLTRVQSESSHYYRVSRNREGFSVIRKEYI